MTIDRSFPFFHVFNQSIKSPAKLPTGGVYASRPNDSTRSESICISKFRRLLNIGRKRGSWGRKYTAGMKKNSPFGQGEITHYESSTLQISDMDVNTGYCSCLAI